MQAFYRYVDVDGDGICARSLPGVHPKGAYFTRGSGHNRLGGYTEDAAEYVEVVDRIARKIAGAAEAVPGPVVQRQDGAEIGIVALGSSDAAVREAVELLAEQGIAADYLRIRGFPFHPAVERFLGEHEHNFVVDQNRDGQLLSLLTLETGVAKERLRSVRYYGGLPLSAHHVVSGVVEQLEQPLRMRALA